MRPTRLAAPLVTLGLLLLGATTEARAADPVVFAAASMKTALDEIAADWAAEGHAAPVISYAGSSALAKQILAGAPADIFISANEKWMDEVEKGGTLVPDTRRDLLGNALVLVGHDAGEVAIADLPATLGEDHLAMALVDSVPAGQYGKAAFESLGLWAQIEPHVAQADNVRAALALVATGEAPYGVVYATDAAAEPKVHVVATFPEESPPPITYPVALLKDGPATGEAKAFLDYLGSAKAVGIFDAQGFTIK